MRSAMPWSRRVPTVTVWFDVLKVRIVMPKFEPRFVPMALFLASAALAASAQASLVQATASGPAALSATLLTPPALTMDPTAALAAQNMLGVVTLSMPLVVNTSMTLQAGNPYLMTVNGNFDLSLWSFVTTLGALQGNLPLTLAQGNLINLLTPPNSSNVIPLPAAGWLFISGVAALGLAVRKRRQAVPVLTGCAAAA